MSRIGKKPIDIPDKVKVDVAGQKVGVQGPKGTLNFDVHPVITVKTENNQVVVTRPDDTGKSRALHGLTRALINNMVQGVTQGFAKNLEVQGVGYKADLKGKKITLSVGYANQIDVDIPEGVDVKVDGGTKIAITGIDKHAVGQFAAKVRAVKKPEVYKGKGIRYEGEQVKLKPGKAFGSK